MRVDGPAAGEPYCDECQDYGHPTPDSEDEKLWSWDPHRHRYVRRVGDSAGNDYQPVESRLVELGEQFIEWLDGDYSFPVSDLREAVREWRVLVGDEVADNPPAGDGGSVPCPFCGEVHGARCPKHRRTQ